jgi:uncharacterized protein YcsI (UPF0317 family)
MVSNCANPKCGKPLHYLREGQIFVFDVSTGSVDANGKRGRRLEHFWLCGECSQTMIMRQSTEGIYAVVRPGSRFRREIMVTGTAAAAS